MRSCVSLQSQQCELINCWLVWNVRFMIGSSRHWCASSHKPIQQKKNYTVKIMVRIFWEPFKLIFTCFTLMFLSRRECTCMTPTANVYNESEKNVSRNACAIWAKAKFSCFFRVLPYSWMTKSFLRMKMRRRNYFAWHKFSCVVASFAWECANSTFIIRIVGFQLYLYTIRFSSKLRQIHFYGIHVTGWVWIPKNAHISCFIWYATHSDLSRIFCYDARCHALHSIYSHFIKKRFFKCMRFEHGKTSA